ncbi:MAG: Gfo/Idh/MocA family oxidoreductase [Candidatus Hydrogenedentes bacterium]|nr:Gfo/Idh/MocA family oxidoreductase [Candidatus Hydrogenedentota bacterium]
MSDVQPGFTRRTFLGSSAAAAGAALFGRPTFAMQAARPLRVAISGLGRRGGELARLCAGMADISVVSVYDPHGGRTRPWAEAVGARHCASFSEALALADAVVIAAPDHVRGAQALEALQANRPVYIEAPMSLRIEESRAIAAMAAARGIAVQAGIAACSDPAWDEVASVCASGELGSLRLGHYHSPTSTRGLSGGTGDFRADDVDWPAFDPLHHQFDAQRYRHWRRYPEYCAGPAAALHLECCALMARATGAAPVARVSATGGVFAHQQPQQIDALLSTVETVDGCIFHLSAGPTAAGQPPVLRGSRGSVRLAGRRIMISMEDGRKEERCAGMPTPTAHLESWLQAVRGGGVCSCPPDLALHAQEVTAAALDALACGRAISV